ncbi:hypothetical protein GCM10020219_087100 [Nonomuraea dietziae]
MTPVPAEARTQEDDAGRLLTLHGVRDGALDAGDAEEVLLRLLDTLGDGRGDFLGLAVADADQAVAVTDDNQGGEAEATTTLHDLGHSVDLHYTLDVRDALVSGATAAIVTTVTPLATGAATATRSCSHQWFLFSVAIRTRARLRERCPREPRCDPRSGYHHGRRRQR